MRRSLGGIVAAVLLSAVALRAEDGVTPTEILLGQSAPFSGAAAGLGTEFWRGAEACFSQVNSAGGVQGRKIDVLAVDDAYNPAVTLPNTLKFVNDSKVFALFDYVGTPTLVAALPAIRRYQPQGLFLFGAFTGAQPQRESPGKEVVFNIRASYRQETAALVGALAGQGIKKIGVFAQNDPYGSSGLDGVKRALAAHQLGLAGEATFERGVPYSTSMAEQVKLLQAAGAEAVIAVGAYTQCAAFVRDARAAGFKGWIANLSFVGADPLLRLLGDESAKSGADLTSRLLNSQVVPAWSDSSVGVVAAYRAAMDQAAPALPSGLGDGSYKPLTYSFASLEGYIDARFFVEILKATPKALTRAAFSREAMRVKADLGGFKLAFNPEDRQASNKVFFTVVRGGQWASVPNLKGLQ
jgi:branched-chain amino acid transport system substrate-binding protein